MPAGWVEQREQRGIQFLETERGVGRKKVCILVVVGGREVALLRGRGAVKNVGKKNLPLFT